MTNNIWKRRWGQSIPIQFLFPDPPPIMPYKKWIYIEWAARARAFYHAFKDSPVAMKGFVEYWNKHVATAAKHGLHLAPYNADPWVELVDKPGTIKPLGEDPRPYPNKRRLLDGEIDFEHWTSRRDLANRLGEPCPPLDESVVRRPEGRG